jgi:hypothetical protein
MSRWGASDNSNDGQRLLATSERVSGHLKNLYFPESPPIWQRVLCRAVLAAEQATRSHDVVNRVLPHSSHSFLRLLCASVSGNAQIVAWDDKLPTTFRSSTPLGHNTNREATLQATTQLPNRFA